jgi:hypothetical protein
MDFQTFKTEITKRAKEAGACAEQYRRALAAENFEQLIKVITDNFTYSCENKIIDGPLLSEVGAEICKASNLFYNISTGTGFLFTDSATVEAWDSATVRASGSATVEAWGSATVRASDSATVEASVSATVLASDSATVRASDSATVEAWGSATVRASDSATVRASDSATVEASDSATVEAWGSATVRAWGSATVRAWGSAYINSYSTIEHKISERVILRYYHENRIVLGEDIKPKE